MTSTAQSSVSAMSLTTGASPNHAGLFSMKSAGLMPSCSQPPPADSTPSPLRAMYSSGVVGAFALAFWPRLNVDSSCITSYVPASPESRTAGGEADCCGEHPPSAPSAATLIVPAAAPFKKSRRDQLCFEVVPMFPLPSIMCPCSDPGVARFCCAAPDVRLHYGAGRGFAITESDDFGIRRVRRTRPPYS